MASKELYTEFMDVQTAFSCLRVRACADFIIGVDFLDLDDVQKHPTQHVLLLEACKQLKAYTQQKKFSFDLPLQMQGTEFQQSVWRALMAIEWGDVQTYGDIARSLDTSPRAVGNACRRNPMPFIVPCHRVVSKTGIGGYAGDTQGAYLRIKRHLLCHEGHVL